MVANLEREAEFGRRERKKRETREALVDAAVELFSANGIDGVTVEQITARADVSERTFYRYFATKEDVLFGDSTIRREQFAATLARSDPDEPILDALRLAAREILSAFVDHPEHTVERQHLIETSDALQARYLRLTEDWATSVSEYVAARAKLAPDDLLPRLVGSCAIAAVRTARTRWLSDPTRDAAAEIDRCFDTLGHLGEELAPF